MFAGGMPAKLGREAEIEEISLSAAISTEDLRERLRAVLDPELGISIVDLGLIYNIEVQPYAAAEGEAPGDEGDQTVTVTMTLTTPGCPAGPHILQQVKDEMDSTEGVRTTNIDLTFSPMWNEEMMSEDVRWILGR